METCLGKKTMAYSCSQPGIWNTTVLPDNGFTHTMNAGVTLLLCTLSCRELAIQLRRDVKPALDAVGVKLLLVSIGTKERSVEFAGEPQHVLFRFSCWRWLSQSTAAAVAAAVGSHQQLHFWQQRTYESLSPTKLAVLLVGMRHLLLLLSILHTTPHRFIHSMHASRAYPQF